MMTTTTTTTTMKDDNEGRVQRTYRTITALQPGSCIARCTSQSRDFNIQGLSKHGVAKPRLEPTHSDGVNGSKNLGNGCSIRLASAVVTFTCVGCTRSHG
jgi:hypothetical protein